MRERIGVSQQEIDKKVTAPDTDDFPLPVVPDWDTLVSKSAEMAKVIDRHLDYESIYQGHELNAIGLCPQQRINLVSDLTSVVQ